MRVRLNTFGPLVITSEESIRIPDDRLVLVAAVQRHVQPTLHGAILAAGRDVYIPSLRQRVVPSCDVHIEGLVELEEV